MVEKRLRDDAEALGEARRRKLQNETVPSDAAAEEQQQQAEPMQEDEDDQSAIPQTPPPQGSAALHAPEPGALKTVNALHMDPSGGAKVYNSREANGAANDAATIARMAAVTVADREAAAVECPVVTFHHHLPVLTELSRVLTATEIDALGMEWRVIWYPHGPYLDDVFVGLFVEMVPPSVIDDDLLDEADALGGVRPPPVTRAVEVEIILVRQGDKSLPDYRRVSTVHDFSEKNPEFGMSKFVARKELLKPENEFLTSDGRVELEIRLHSISTDGQEDASSATSECSNLVYPPPSPVANETAANAAATLASATHQDLMMYDSKQETGMVGLKNQGATCYMNSLLQTLFHLHAFRQVVYATPTEQEDTNDSVSLALQRVFYRLQMQNKAVSTKELTRSFGWSQIDSFMQHDVQELYRILCDRLEEKMKHTKVDGTIKNLFEGKVRSFIQCVNVDYQSFRDESFYDLQLLVKDCKDIYESLRKYVEVEMLQGDDQYEAEGHGKQDARKGLHFLQFPPVLNIQLKRFEFDPMRDGMVKIHDRFEFPKVLVLDEFVQPLEEDKSAENGATQETQPTKPKHVYHLHSVLVHSGDVHGGHYYVFIRPAKDIASSTEWFKFDDDQISRVDEQVAVEGNFGSSATVNGHTEQSAYSAMLSPDGSGAADNQNMGFRSALEDDERTEDVYDFTQSNSPGPSNGNSLMLPLGRSFSSAYMLVYVRDGDNDIQQLEGITDEPSKVESDFTEVETPSATDDTLQTDIDTISQSDESVPIPEGLLKRFHEEERATARRKKMQQTEHLYMTLRIASDWTVSKLKKITKTMDFSSFSNNACVRIRIKRNATIRQLYQRIYAFKGVPVHRQRLWKVITRENRTNRPDTPLTDELLDMPVNYLIDEDASPKSPVRLYLQILSEPSTKKAVLHRHFWSEFTPPEREEQDEEKQEGDDDDEDDAAIVPLEECEFSAPVDPNDIMLFIKCYDVTKKLGHRLEYKGNLLIDARKTGADLERAIKEALDIPSTTRLRLYEEIQPITVSEVEKGRSLVSAEIQHGDIICYQYANAKSTKSTLTEDATSEEKSEEDSVDAVVSTARTQQRTVEKYPNVESYFQYLLDRVEVVFHQYNHPDEDPFALTLLYSNHYDDIIDAVAEHLGLGMEKRLHLRLYQHSPLSNQPKKSPLRHSRFAGDRETTLDGLLTEYMERTGILYYEILPNPITEIEAKKQVMVYFSIYDECFVDPSAPTTSRRLELLVLPTYTVQDLVSQIKQTFELTEETALRVCEVSHGGTMIQRILPEETPLEKFWSPSSGYTSTNDHRGLFVEKIPDEELAEDAITVREIGSEDEAENDDDEEENALFRIGVVHFNYQSNTKVWIHPHGVPFVLYFRESDTIAQIKARMRKRIGVSEKTFSRWNLAFVKDIKASAIKEVYENMDMDAIDSFTMGKLEEICGQQYENILNFGLEHADPKPSAAKLGRRQEQGIRIRQN